MPEIAEELAISNQASQEIEKLLSDAYVGSIRQTDEYRLGRLEERFSIKKSELLQIKEKTVPIAEAFYNGVTTTIPSLKILQHRIGIDYSTGAPAVLMIIDKAQVELIAKIRSIARKFELAAWEIYDFDGYIWTKSNENIEQDLINRDFPFFKKNI
jgi:hypothetical protein